MTKELKTTLKGYAFISPWIIGFAVFLLVPIVLSFYYSFCDYDLLRRPAYIGLANYTELWHDGVFWIVLKNTLVYAAIALPAGLLVSLGLALLLNVNIPGQPLFRTIIFLPSLVPIVASAMIWLWLFNTKLGLINNLLANAGTYAAFLLSAAIPATAALILMIGPPTLRGELGKIRFGAGIVSGACIVFLCAWAGPQSPLYSVLSYFLGGRGIEGTIKMGWLNNWLHLTGVAAYKDIPLPPPWLTDSRFALPALAFMSLWGVGYTVVIFLAGLQDVPRELYEAAEIDGASSSRRLWHVTLPMISPVIFFNLIMAIIGTLQVFAIPYIMTNGGPDRATYFYTMYLYDNAFVFLRMGYASAMAWIQLLIILAFTALAFWSSKRWVHYQGK